MKAFTPIKDIVEKYQVSFEWLVEQAEKGEVKFWAYIDLSECTARDEKKDMSPKIKALSTEIHTALKNDDFGKYQEAVAMFNNVNCILPGKHWVYISWRDAIKFKLKETVGLTFFNCPRQKIYQTPEQEFQNQKGPWPKPKSWDEVRRDERLEKEPIYVFTTSTETYCPITRGRISSAPKEIKVSRNDIFISLEDFRKIEEDYPELFILREQQKAYKKGPDPEKSSVAALSILLKIIKRAKKEGRTPPIGTGEEFATFLGFMGIDNLSESSVNKKITSGNKEIEPHLEKINQALDELFTSVPAKNAKK